MKLITLVLLIAPTFSLADVHTFKFRGMIGVYECEGSPGGGESCVSQGDSYEEFFLKLSWKEGECFGDAKDTWYKTRDVQGVSVKAMFQLSRMSNGNCPIFDKPEHDFGFWSEIGIPSQKKKSENFTVLKSPEHFVDSTTMGKDFIIPLSGNKYLRAYLFIQRAH